MMTASVLIISSTNPPRGALVQKIKKTGVFTDIFVCESGKEVISVLGQQTIDMICWAYGQNEVNAPEWLDALQINPAWTDIPLLVFTKEGETELRLQALELGACDCVTFVTPTTELTARFQGHLKRSQQITRLRNRRAELAQMALNDPLTGLANRTSFDLRLSQEIARSRRSGQSFGLLLIDLDHFKWFNDCYGHQAGDTILKAFSQSLSESVRDSDIACRYGGEEFAIILPGATVTSASLLAERIHRAIEQLSRDLWQDHKSLTASIGLTCFDGTRSSNCSELVAEADNALYQAKDKGRNQTVKFQPPPQGFNAFFPNEPPEANQLSLN